MVAEIEKKHELLLTLEETLMERRNEPEQKEDVSYEDFHDGIGICVGQSFRGNVSCESAVTAQSAMNHPLWPEIERVTKEQLHYASVGVGEGVWQLFAQDGDMKMYKREKELNGLVVDPLKACHIVKGVTAREMCHYFFAPAYRKDWETTLENMKVIEKISQNVLVFLQVHKRIWPTAQRDALFWSHMTKVTDHNDQDTWAVVNNSTQLPKYPQTTNNCIRVTLSVCLYCQTLIPKNAGQLSRDNISCKITYCSVVNPGGWVPASVLRAIYRREYPKFLKSFTVYVKAQTKDKPIMF